MKNRLSQWISRQQQRQSSSMARLTTLVAMGLAGVPVSAHAQMAVFDSMVAAGCTMIAPLVGANSKFLSLVFVVVLLTMVLLWWMNENKEGMVIWVIRVGLAIGILINIFSLPPLLGMAGVCA